MSVDYWGIVGYGICLDDVSKYLNAEKVNDLVRKLMPKETFEEDVFDDDTFFGDPYSNLAEFLCEFDDERIFSWEDDGQGTAYFLYEPSYPWQIKPNSPVVMNDIKDRMIKILKKIYDAPYEELENYIDFISTYGCC